MFAKRKRIEQFGKAMVDELVKQFPPDKTQKKQRTAEKKLTRVLERVHRRARKFHDEEKLGFMGKSRLGNSFRWALEDAGYDEEIVKLATESLLVYLQK